MHDPTGRIAHTTAFVTPAVEHWLEQEIAQWVRPMKDHSDDPSHHEQTLLPQSYIWLLGNNGKSYLIGVIFAFVISHLCILTNSIYFRWLCRVTVLHSIAIILKCDSLWYKTCCPLGTLLYITYLVFISVGMIVFVTLGARCSSMVRAFAHGVMGSSDRSFMEWTHWAISRSSQCSTTGVIKAVVCAILSVGWCI